MPEKPSSLEYIYENENSLYSSYMPFVSGGGLFIKTHHSYGLGEELQLTVRLLDEADTYSLNAKVVWITPKGAQSNKPQGIGVQLQGENSRYLFSKIETYLAGMLKSNQMTDTL